MRVLLRAMCAGIVAVAATAIPASAQVIEIAPQVGMHTPIGLLVEGYDVRDNSFVRRRQLGGLLIGANVALRPTRRLGAEINATYTPTMVAITDRNATQDIGGSVVFASLRGVARIKGEFSQGRWGVYVAPGVGLVRRGGGAWAGLEGTTDKAIVIGAGTRVGLMGSQRAFRFDLTDYITRAAFNSPTERSAARIHHDLIWSFGLTFPLTR